MSAPTINTATFEPSDDDGSGTTGTIASQAWFDLFIAGINALAALLWAIPVRSLFKSSTPGSNGTTAETDLITTTLAAGQLARTNDSIRIRIFGTAAANANSKTYKVYFGTTVVLSFNTSLAGNTTWDIVVEVIRTGAATQIARGYWNGPTTGFAALSITAPTETLSGALTVKVTGQSGTAGNDITAKFMAIDFVPAP